MERKRKKSKKGARDSELVHGSELAKKCKIVPEK
jgi:hypothetical protein